MNFSKMFPIFLLVTTVSLSGFPVQGADPLFVSLTSNDPHRAEMAISFAKAQFERGHHPTIYLNDKGVLVASTKDQVFGKHQKLLTELMDKGANIYVCPFCLKHYGLQEGDLVKGAKVSNPELTGTALFKEGSRTLVW